MLPEIELVWPYRKKYKISSAATFLYWGSSGRIQPPRIPPRYTVCVTLKYLNPLFRKLECKTSDGMVGIALLLHVWPFRIINLI